MRIVHAILLNLGCLTRLMPAVKSSGSANRDTESPFNGSVHSMAGNCWKLYLMRSRMSVSNSARSIGLPLCHKCLASHSSLLTELTRVFPSINFIFSFQVTHHDGLWMMDQARLQHPLCFTNFHGILYFLPVPQ
jgi:hypothetical protein